MWFQFKLETSICNSDNEVQKLIQEFNFCSYFEAIYQGIQKKFLHVSLITMEGMFYPTKERFKCEMYENNENVHRYSFSAL